MKKFTAIVVAMIMALSLSITVFADSSTVTEEGGMVTISVDIPASGGYTAHIPANTELKYGDTSWQKLSGKLYVSDVTDQSIYKINVSLLPTPLTNIEDSEDTISTEFGYYFFHPDVVDNLLDSVTGRYSGFRLYDLELAADGDWDTPYSPSPITLNIQVKDWTGATRGATYQATITFQFNITSKEGNNI